MRTRVRGSLSNAQYIKTDYNPNGSVGSITVVPSSSKSEGTLESMTDVVTPGYAVKKAHGSVFMNPLTQSKDSRRTSTTPLSFGTHPVWGRRVYTGDMACIWCLQPNTPSWFSPRVVDAQNRTLIGCYSKVATPPLQGLVSIAEARETVSMLARPFKLVDDLVDNIYGRRLTLLRKGLTVLDAATSAWLEYRLGWKPLLYDIQNMMNAYLERCDDNYENVREVSRSSEQITWEGNSTSTAVPSGLTTCRVNGVFSRTADVSSGVLYELRDDSFFDAQRRRLGMRLSDLPATAWELVPLSFVVDRFVNVGDWLNAVTPKPGVTILGSWTKTKTFIKNTSNIASATIYVATAPAATYSASGGQYSEEITTTVRTANPSLPLSPVMVERPLTFQQYVDHAALIVARLRGLTLPHDGLSGSIL